MLDLMPTSTLSVITTTKTAMEPMGSMQMETDMPLPSAVETTVMTPQPMSTPVLLTTGTTESSGTAIESATMTKMVMAMTLRAMAVETAMMKMPH